MLYYICMVKGYVNKSGYHYFVFNPRAEFSLYNTNHCHKFDYVGYSVSRTRRIIRQIIHNNITDIQKVSFLTLTFRSEKYFDYSAAVYEFTKFIKRLKYNFFEKNYKLKYLAVPEKQKRRVWHFHVILFDVPYLYNEKLAEIWGLGFIKINQVKDVKGLSDYICKYITKQFVENFEKGKKRVFTSRGLDRGISLRFYDDREVERINLYLQHLYSYEDFRLIFSYENKEEGIFQNLFEVYFSKEFYSYVKEKILDYLTNLKKYYFYDLTTYEKIYYNNLVKNFLDFEDEDSDKKDKKTEFDY